VYVSAVGYSGYSGYSGTNGSNGTSGFSGYSGTNGSNGASGTSGYSGTNGSAGSTGTSGYSGYSGATGAGASTSANTVGAYGLVWNYSNSDRAFNQGTTFSAGGGSNQAQAAIWDNGSGNWTYTNSLSGTWRNMTANMNTNSTTWISLMCRIS
jgi:hypothetical protein